MASNNEDFTAQENFHGAKASINKDKLKEYGMKSYAPLLNVITQYQEHLTPYLVALAKGLQSAAETLSGEHASEVEKYVGHVFQEAHEGLKVATGKLQAKDVQEFTTYLNELSAQKPVLMFSASYLAGLVLGRLGRHVNMNSHSTTSEQSLN